MVSGDRAPGKAPEIKWEDDDEGFGREGSLEKNTDFESLLESRDDDQPFIRVGERAKGQISSLPKDGADVLVDLGGKLSGIIDKAELLDESGNLTVKLGDSVDAFVLSRKGDEILLSMKLSQQLRSLEDLEAAYQRKLPVRGRVTKAVKGGFEVTILGKTAFCPISQIDSRFVEQGAEYVGKDLEFIIEKFESRGRNIVVGRKSLLKQQAEGRIKELMAKLTPETVLDGVVKELRDFGAFVDIGGVDGMVHISEISYTRVAKPADQLSVGDKVRVKILKVEHDDKGRPKISLSMKAAAKDPWDDVEKSVVIGKTYTGRVTKLMQFGAFVELSPGFEGLVHVSEMSWMKRIHHPSDVVKEGQAVTVVVKDLDRAQKRIALTMKQVEDDPWFDATSRFPTGKILEGKVERLKSFGAIVELSPGVSGMLPLAIMKRKFGEAYRQAATPGKSLEVRIGGIDGAERRIQLTLTGIDDDDGADASYQEYLKEEKRAAETASAQAAGTGMGSLGALLSAKLGQKK